MLSDNEKLLAEYDAKEKAARPAQAAEEFAKFIETVRPPPPPSRPFLDWLAAR